MPALDNRKQEIYAQGLAKGLEQLQAYTEAGYANNAAAACKLAKQGKVQARIKELQERAAIKSEITAASIAERLLAIAEKGEGTNNPAMLAVARAALMDTAKLHGLIIDKAEVKDVTPIDPAARQAEIDRLLAKRGGHLRAVT